MSTAKEALDRLSQDPETSRIARERADAVKLYKLDLAASHAEGRAEGQIQLLLKQLRLRFGELPESIHRRVETADSECLESWGERILTAGTLDGVFAS